MKKYLRILSLFLFAFPVLSQTPSGPEILDKVDQTMNYRNSIVESKMIIHGRRGTRTIEARSWVGTEDQTFTEYLAPPREAGTKMLKEKDQLWTYSPSTDRTIRISGHLLRQSVMGSDLSYEDMMEDPDLNRIYESEVTGRETVLNQPCWVLNLTANTQDASYYRREIWVDRKHWLVLKEKRYAKSDKLLKTTETEKIENIDGRWLASHVRFKDELKSGEGTEFVIISIEFNADIPQSRFSKASLRR